MVHITYRHGEDSTEEKRVILKEYHFYISDDMCHDLDFVQHSESIVLQSLRGSKYIDGTTLDLV